VFTGGLVFTGGFGVHKAIGVFLGEGSMFHSRLCCSHRVFKSSFNRPNREGDDVVERGCLGGIPGSCCRGLESLPA
jgi:hypothetical protein